MLLKERWLLTQQGVDKKDIKLKSSILYVQGKKYAEVSNSNLVKFFTISSSTPTDRNNAANNDSSNPIQTATPLLSPSRQSQPTSN